MFTFEFERKEKRYLVVFTDQQHGDERDYTNFFAQLHRGRIPPDHVIHILPNYLCQQVEYLTDPRGSAYAAAKQHSDQAVWSILSFDEAGHLSTFFSDEDFEKGDCERWKDVETNIITQGISALVQQNSVIEVAPPGTIFYKPSGRRSKDFINIAKLSENSCQDAFIAFSLLRYFRGLEDNDTLFLDTPATSSYIAGLTRMLGAFGYTPRIQWQCYDAYNGLKDLQLNTRGRNLFLVSASSSNRLAEQIEDTLQVDTGRVFTLLSYKGGPQVIANIFALRKHAGIPKTPETNPIDIRRSSQSFSGGALPPRSVMLKIKHQKKLDMKLFELFHNNSLFQCNQQAQGDETQRELAFDTSDLTINCINHDKWLDRFCDMHVPGSLRRIYVQDSDTLGQLMAQHIVERINKPDVDICCYAAAGQHDYAHSSEAVVVIASTHTDAHGFMDMNRALRAAHQDGMRIFLSAFSLFDSMASRRVFVSSLVRAPDAERYKFVTKYETFAKITGRENPWLRETALIAEMAVSSPYWEHKHTILSDDNGLNGALGNCRDTNKKPEFTRDFTFWDFPYNPAATTGEAIYFTFAAILQYARESKLLKSEDSLKPSPFQQALLAPGNFLRFNDHIFQSALIRCAEESELDYRMSKDCSCEFAEFTCDLLQNHQSNAAELIADLLIAFTIGKIRLHADHLPLVLSALEDTEPHLDEHLRILSLKTKGQLSGC